MNSFPCRVLKPILSREVNLRFRTAVVGTADRHTFARHSTPISLSSSSSQSPSEETARLWSSQDADNWPSPMTLRHSAGSVTLQLADVVEGSEGTLQKPPEEGMQEFSGREARCGNVDLACSMQSNCPEPYESRNKSPCHLNMPGGSAMAQHKHRSSELHDIVFSCPRPMFA